MRAVTKTGTDSAGSQCVMQASCFVYVWALDSERNVRSLHRLITLRLRNINV